MVIASEICAGLGSCRGWFVGNGDVNCNNISFLTNELFGFWLLFFREAISNSVPRRAISSSHG